MKELDKFKKRKGYEADIRPADAASDTYIHVVIADSSLIVSVASLVSC